MALDARTAQEHLTPDERRAMLRAFADRMLLKASAMDDPEDMPGVERAVRVAAAIERVYSRCDRAEARAPDPLKLEAARVHAEIEGLKARASLAAQKAWDESRHFDLGHWRKTKAPAAETAAVVIPEPAPEYTVPSPQRGEETPPPVRYVDYTDDILAARVELGLDPAPLRSPGFSGESGKDPAHHPPARRPSSG